MGYTVHFWSDIPGKFSRSSEPSAEGHADEEGGVALEVNGLIELELHLHNFAYDSIDVDTADFHTHGSPGSISLGGDDLNFKTLERFMSKGYDQIFNAKAEVEFHGCNVAEGFQGEFFLIRFGQTFLKKKEERLAGMTRPDSISAMRLRIPGGTGSRLRSLPEAGLVCRAIRTSNGRGLPIAWRNSA
jgi:Domain of unknown function (DUF4347)